MRKCIQNKEDINLALLDIHVTPLDGNIPSPSELLFNKKLCFQAIVTGATVAEW